MTERDDPLIAAAGNGDAAAIEELLLRHLPHLRSYVRRQVGPLVAGKESLADLVQSVCREALERAADGRLEPRGEGEFVEWLHRAAMLKILNRHRYWSSGRRDEVVPLADDRPAADRSPTEGAVAREELDRFAAAFARLDPDQQAIIVLAHVEGLPHRVIGERLGIDEAHSRTRLSRALARLAHLAAGP